MIILALDTTTRAGSAAVVRDGLVVAEHTGDAGVTHGQRLPADLERVLDAASIRIDAVDMFAVAAGPGSFTGLRVGIATVQGLALARGRLVVPVPVLEALARSAPRADQPVAAWMDAQRGEVFAQLYAPGCGASVLPAVSAPPAVVLDAMAGIGGEVPVFIGDGAVRYAADIRARYGADLHPLPPPALAGTIGRMAAADQSRAVHPHALAPIYIRRPDAELVRARRDAGV